MPDACQWSAEPPIPDKALMACRQGSDLHAEDAQPSAHMLHQVYGAWRHMGHLMHMPSHTFIRVGRYAPSTAGLPPCLSALLSVHVLHVAGAGKHLHTTGFLPMVACTPGFILKMISGCGHIGRSVGGTPTHDVAASVCADHDSNG